MTDVSLCSFDELVSAMWGAGTYTVSREDVEAFLRADGFLYLEDGEYAHAIILSDEQRPVTWK